MYIPKVKSHMSSDFVSKSNIQILSAQWERIIFNLSPLTLDITVMCIPEPEILQQMAVTQGVLPPDTVNKTVAGFDTSTPAVATPATVVGKPDPQSKDFPTLRLSESTDLLPSFGLSSSSSSSSSPTLPWGTAEDSSPSFSPNRVREGLSQNGSGEGSLFNVSPLSPGFVVRPTREGGAAPSEWGSVTNDVRGLRWFGSGRSDHLCWEIRSLMPNSALLMDSPSFWVEELGKEQAMAAAVN